jgi:hypothetical protein
MASKQDYEICALIEQGKSKAEVGRLFGVSPRTVGRAVERVIKEKFDKYRKSEVEPIGGVRTFEVKARPKYSYSVVVTEEHLTIIKNPGNSVYISNTDARFEDFFSQIMRSRGSQSVLESLYERLSPISQLEACEAFGVEFDHKTCQVSFHGEPISEGLGNRLVEAAKNRDMETFESLAAFTKNLNQNPSYRAVNELYEFLVASDIKITKDGVVECFKRVNENYTDVYTGKFDNSPGKYVHVPRNKVDENSEVTCSYGLHVCSKAYLSSYSGARVVKVHVHPKDFVAIPKDYYSIDGQGQVKAKARVCAYKVIEDVTEEVL